MNKSSAGMKRSPLYLLLLGLTFAVISVAAWSASSSPAMASILAYSATATPNDVLSYAFADIAKPTYTALPSAVPISVSTETLELAVVPELIQAEIVSDTATPEYSSGYITPSGDFSAPAYGGNKYILVDISEQYMYVYEGDTLIYSFVASTGMNNATRVGTFSVLDKIPNAYGSTWNIWMPNWLGIYWAGGLENGIHALPILPSGAQLWEGYLGTPISFGCVVLGSYESTLLFTWAEIGTPVEIRW